mmetsp:Transcript_23800/g.38214  ORF Transcript_23800/g.38214 Transcript_23800/m.38214 type:complete len:104 (+) Transcript_23800:256-567(+)
MCADLVNSLKKECQLSVEEKFIITNHMFVKCNGVRKYQITWKKEQPLSEILYKDPFSIVLHIDHVDSSSSAMAPWERIVWRPPNAPPTKTQPFPPPPPPPPPH